MHERLRTVDVTDPEGLLTIEEVARILDLSVSAVRARRHRGLGPPSFRRAGRVRYRRTELAEWLLDEETRSRTAS